MCSKALTDGTWHKPIRKSIQNMESDIKDAQTMIWREDGQKYLFQAKRVRVLLTCLLFMPFLIR